MHKCEPGKINMFGKPVECFNSPMTERVDGPVTYHRKEANKKTGHEDIIMATRPIRYLTKCFFHASSDEPGRETGNEWSVGRRPSNYREARRKDWM